MLLTKTRFCCSNTNGKLRTVLHTLIRTITVSRKELGAMRHYLVINDKEYKQLVAFDYHTLSGNSKFSIC